MCRYEITESHELKATNMLATEQLNQIIVNEADVGERLNQSVHHNDRADFALLLAMMSQDQLDAAQFHLPSGRTERLTQDEQALAKSFGAGVKQPLAESDIQYQHDDLAALLATASMTDVRFRLGLKPEPLAKYNDPKRISDEVLDALEPTVQRKVVGMQTPLTEKPISPSGFYDAILASRAFSHKA